MLGLRPPEAGLIGPPELANDEAFSEPSIVASGIHTVATNILQVAGALAMAILIARTLGPEGKSAYDLFVATVTLLSTVLGMSLVSGITYVVASSRVDVTRLTRMILLFALAEGGAASLVVWVIAKLPFRETFVPAQISGAAPLLLGSGVAAVALSSMYRAAVTGQRRFVRANRGDIAKQGLGLALAIAALLLATRIRVSLAVAMIAGNVLTVFAASAIYRSAVRDTGCSAGEDSGFRRCVAYSIPSYLGTLVQFLNYRLDVFFVSTFSGTGKLGLYQTAVLLAQSLSLLPAAAQAVLFPTVASSGASEGESARRVARANRTLMFVSAMTGTVLLLVAPWGVPVLFGTAFREAVPALLWLIPGAVVFTTNTVLAGYFAGVGRPRVNLIAACVGVGLTIPLDIFMIPRWGIVGAAIASSISYTASTIAICWLFVRETGLSVKQLMVVEAGDIVILRGRLEPFLRSARPRWTRPRG